MSEIALEAATLIRSGFATYHAQFRALTRRAARCFEQRDWRRSQENARRRLDLYSAIVDKTVASVCGLLGEQVQQRGLWTAMQAGYSGLIEGRDDCELAETFFNSISRRVFTTVGVDKQIEFINSEILPFPAPGKRTPAICRGYRRSGYGSLQQMVRAMLQSCRVEHLHDIDGAAARIAAQIGAATTQVSQIDLVNAVFYRGKSAYLIGRVLHSGGRLPLVIALLHPPQGVVVDAVLLTADETSIVFSFAHTYFHVEIDRPGELIAFLQSLVPRKPTADLWISIGYNRHGKTVLYRDLVNHLANSPDRFEIAEGTPGMVMLVFTLSSFAMVFKVIKDRFDYPKRSTPEQVMERYKLVFRHDRAGRLLDAQSFEFLEFARDRFDPELLALLQQEAGSSVSCSGNRVAIRFLYTERRITPLNLYLGRQDEAGARAAALEYGQAIKDLAATNIFPGDLFLKNFGVTRHGRVLFYDYDELCFVTDCRFRRIPPPRSWEDEIADQVWYRVGDQDVFPEQFVHFLGLRPELKKLFLEQHGEIVTVAFWRDLQRKHEAGWLPDIFPYQAGSRLSANEEA